MKLIMGEKKYVEKKAMLEYIDKNIIRMIPDKDGKHPIPIEAVRNFMNEFILLFMFYYY